MERVILIAEQLSQEGKVPNTALLKARLANNVPLPVIIQGLKMWQENPQKALEMPTEKALGETVTNESLLEAKIAQAIAPLKAEIETLKAELKRLQKQPKPEDKNRVY